MIITVTDAKELTDFIAANKDNNKEIKKKMENLFVNHLTCLEQFKAINWKIIKSTGDGVLMLAWSSKMDSEFFLQWCEAMTRLYKMFDDKHPIRIISHYCETKHIISKLELDIPKLPEFENIQDFISHLKNDIFGLEVNKVFRLAQLIKTNCCIVTESLLRIGIPNSEMTKFDEKKLFQVDQFSFGPAIPITYLKGIKQVSFTDEKSSTKPLWVWEVIAND